MKAIRGPCDPVSIMTVILLDVDALRSSVPTRKENSRLSGWFRARRGLAVLVSSTTLLGCTGTVGDPVGTGDSGGSPASSGGTGGAVGGASSSGGSAVGGAGGSAPMAGGGGSSGMGAGTGGSSGSGGGAGGSGGAPVAFAPSGGAYRRLTDAAFRNSLRDLLGGPVDVGDIEPDSWQVGGLPTVGAAVVSISPRGVDQYLSAIEAATAQVFADVVRRDAVLGCTPANEADTACFEQFVTTFGERAFRRPLTTAQVTRYTGLIASAATTLADASEGMRAGMQGLLLSPNFLYRLERGEPSGAANGFWQYTSTEMASRLSYFLTSTTPDDALLDLAEQNALQTPEAVRQQAERLLASEKGRESIGNFAAELFQLEVLWGRPKDAGTYPEFTPELQAGMMREIPALFQSVVFDTGGSVLDLFTTRSTFVNKELAALYGLPTTGLTSTSLSPVTLPADGLRAGLMGTAGILAKFASQKEGSPTQRGKFIREVLLCEHIDLPPDGVNMMLPEAPAGTVLTKREKLSIHAGEPKCAGCHALLDPLGLTLENFDAIGKYRENDLGKALDVSGDLDGTPFSGPVELGQLLASSPNSTACMVRSIYRYGTGHVETPSEHGVVADLTSSFIASGHKLRQLMVDLVTSDGFRYVAPPAP
jgi:hypothetical protein